MVLDQPELPKYLRYGYYNQDRHSDALVSAFVSELPGDGILPARWRYDSHGAFLALYSELGDILWAKSSNSHLLVVFGQKVLRIWTDAKHHCLVEAQSHILTGWPVSAIPDSNKRKSAPFTQRVKITTTEDMYSLAVTTKRVYGI